MVKKGVSKNSSAGADPKGPRLRRLSRRQKKAKAKAEAKSLPSPIGSFRLTWRTLATLKKYWKPFAGITLVYLILNVIFANVISNISTVVSDIKLDLEVGSSENLSPFGSALNGFGNLVASGGTSSSTTGSTLQTMLIILQSLVIIWALRHLLAGKKIKVKQAYYESMTPLIPFLLVLLVILIQLIPVGFLMPTAATFLSAVFVTGSTGTVLSLLIGGLLALWSLYMVSSSVFALYIVTLPGMHPRRALKSAKNLVRFRRWAIMRRLLFLPIFILLAMALIVVPLILFATFLVTPVFILLSLLSLLFAHTYVYSLYRELIK